MPRQIDQFHERRIGNANQHRYATIDQLRRFTNHLSTQSIAQTGRFASCAEDEDPGHATIDHVVKKSRKPIAIEFIASKQRTDQRRHDPLQLQLGGRLNGRVSVRRNKAWPERSYWLPPTPQFLPGNEKPRR